MTELQTHWFPSQKQDVLPAMLVPGSHSPWQHQAGKKMQDDFYWFLIFTPTISAYGQLKLCVWLCCDLNYSLCWVHCRLIRGREPWSCFHKQLRLFFFPLWCYYTEKCKYNQEEALHRVHIHSTLPALFSHLGGLLEPCLSPQAGHLRSLLRAPAVPGCS